MGAQQSIEMRRNALQDDSFPVQEAIETILAIIDEPEDETDKEIEAGLEERRLILEDCYMLKQYAAFHLHPERPVDSSIGDGTAFARCYFNRPSAPQQESFEDAEERVQIFDDCEALRTCAASYLNEEFLCANAIGRYEVLVDVESLKLYAKFHLHPELPVETTDPLASARNYFGRPSAPERETRDEAEEHHYILEDVRQLEDSVQMQHFGHVLDRDVFHCDYEMVEETVEEEDDDDVTDADRTAVLNDTEALKMFAKFHLHPELPVKTEDPLACERNYFDRPSAPERETQEEAEEHHRILEDAKHLEDLVQLQHFGRVLETDYFHCNFAMDEDVCSMEHDEPVLDCDEESVPARVTTKRDDDGNLSTSPASIFQFAM